MIANIKFSMSSTMFILCLIISCLFINSSYSFYQCQFSNPNPNTNTTNYEWNDPSNWIYCGDSYPHNGSSAFIDFRNILNQTYMFTLSMSEDIVLKNLFWNGNSEIVQTFVMTGSLTVDVMQFYGEGTGYIFLTNNNLNIDTLILDNCIFVNYNGSNPGTDTTYSFPNVLINNTTIQAMSMEIQNLNMSGVCEINDCNITVSSTLFALNDQEAPLYHTMYNNIIIFSESAVCKFAKYTGFEGDDVMLINYGVIHGNPTFLYFDFVNYGTMWTSYDISQNYFSSYVLKDSSVISIGYSMGPSNSNLGLNTIIVGSMFVSSQNITLGGKLILRADSYLGQEAIGFNFAAFSILAQDATVKGDFSESYAIATYTPLTWKTKCDMGIEFINSTSISNNYNASWKLGLSECGRLPSKYIVGLVLGCLGLMILIIVSAIGITRLKKYRKNGNQYDSIQ